MPAGRFKTGVTEKRKLRGRNPPQRQRTSSSPHDCPAVPLADHAGELAAAAFMDHRWRSSNQVDPAAPQVAYKCSQYRALWSAASGLFLNNGSPEGEWADHPNAALTRLPLTRG